MSAVHSSNPINVHLVVIIHGLWGSPDHVSYLANTLRKIANSSIQQSNDQLEILIPNSIQWTNTYDGIDYCAEHVAREIDLRRQELESDQRKLIKFSCIGYSLGGLIGRFLIGLLHSRQPSFFEQVKPINFNTFASPWIGIPKYKTIASQTINFFGARLLSRTGNQLYLIDRFHELPSNSNSSDRKQSGIDQKDVGRVSLVDQKKRRKRQIKFPLLSILAHPQTSFYKALSNFQVVVIYANAINDRTVPFVTGAIEKFDLFSISKQISLKSKLVKQYLDDLTEVDLLQIGGLELKFNPDCSSLIESVDFSEISQNASYLSTKEGMASTMTKMDRWKKSLPKLPYFLKPSTYPFRTPLNYLVAGLSPLIAPVFLTYILSSFCYQSYQSRRRIKKYNVGDLENPSSRLRRVGLLQELEQDLIEDIVGIGNGTSLENDQDLPTNQLVSIDDSLKDPDDRQAGYQSETCEPIETNPKENQAQPLMLNYPGQADSTSLTYDDGSVNQPPKKNVSIIQGTQYPRSLFLQDSKLPKHDAGLSPLQIEMLEHLNSLPNLVKFVSFFDGVPNSHGAIIYRAEGLSDKRGRKVVLHWAERFIL